MILINKHVQKIFVSITVIKSKELLKIIFEKVCNVILNLGGIRRLHGVKFIPFVGRFLGLRSRIRLLVFLLLFVELPFDLFHIFRVSSSFLL